MAGQTVEISVQAILQGPVPCPVCFDQANWESCTWCSGAGQIRWQWALEILGDSRHDPRKTERYFEALGDGPVTEALRFLLQKRKAEK